MKYNPEYYKTSKSRRYKSCCSKVKKNSLAKNKKSRSSKKSGILYEIYFYYSLVKVTVANPLSETIVAM